MVAHNADDCIGCQYCTWNCPYSVPAFQPDRRIVTKCDMCLPRLEDGLKPACVGACPTRALDVEAVDVAAWTADHAEADAPHLPPAGLTLSTTRIVLPQGDLGDTVAASDFDLAPEHPHWPLVVLTVLTQVALGISLTATGQGQRLAAAAVAGGALGGSLLHLGRPVHAWKALRNLRRSWLSREVLLLGAYAAPRPSPWWRRRWRHSPPRSAWLAFSPAAGSTSCRGGRRGTRRSRSRRSTSPRWRPARC